MGTTRLGASPKLRHSPALCWNNNGCGINSDGINSDGTAYTVDQAQGQAIAFTECGRKEGRTLEYQTEQIYCLTNPGSGGRAHSRQIMTPQMQVRRLTPLECERLQGFPDGYTCVPFKGKVAADCPRYKALGNSMAVPVMRWIGERIANYEEEKCNLSTTPRDCV